MSKKQRKNEPDDVGMTARPASGGGSARTAPVPRGSGDARAREMVDWIGNTYLDDSGRDSPASLNSTGDM